MNAAPANVNASNGMRKMEGGRRRQNAAMTRRRRQNGTMRRRR